MNARVSVHLLLAAAVLLAACQPSRADTAAAAPLRVALAPVEVDRPNGFVWRAMIEECTRIWAREGVVLSWSGDDPDADVVLPLVFDNREVSRHDSKSTDAFGITQFNGRSQRIVVSIARARQVASRRHGHADTGDGTTLDIVAGRVLGRVVAHEIGHALLLTTRHAASGLMHPHIDAEDARPALDAQFALSSMERTALAMRFSNRTPVPRGTNVAGFTWRDAPPALSRLRAQR